MVALALAGLELAAMLGLAAKISWTSSKKLGDDVVVVVVVVVCCDGGLAAVRVSSNDERRSTSGMWRASAEETCKARSHFSMVVVSTFFSKRALKTDSQS